MNDGWECPKCGAVMAPWMPNCVNDHKPKIGTGTDSPLPYLPTADGTAMRYRRCGFCGGNYNQCHGSHTIS